MTKLTKKEVIGALATKLESTKKEAEELLNLFTETIEELIVDEHASFALGTIGTFKVVEVPEREHHNPQTGEKIVKPAHLTLKFKASKSTKETLQDVVIVEE